MRTVVLGGPGCGKTTALLAIIDDLLAKGVSPARIGFLTFTKKAAREARDRACTKFGFEKEEIPYFRTIHSFAFKQLGLTPDAVMSDKLHNQFGKWAGYDLSRKTDENMGITSATYDDELMTTLSLARLMRQPLEHVCELTSVTHRQAARMTRDFERFKYERGVIDFTDMLEDYLSHGDVPPLDVLIVDEAQDLSNLQWRIVEKIAATVNECYFAGDDDQAIYGWAGADVAYFLSLEGRKRVLPVSYRLKSAVFKTSQSLVHQIQHRFEKDWKPHADGGDVSYVEDIHSRDVSNGSWFLLARNAYLLKQWKAYLYMHGHPFIDGDKSTVDNDEVRSIMVWEALRKEREITGMQAGMLYENIKQRHLDDIGKASMFDPKRMYTLRQLRDSFGLLTTEAWFDVLDFAPHKQRYYSEIKHRGGSLVKTPQITVSTIHGVKGGEADNVLLSTDMSRKTHEHLTRNPADELRVFFVGASRARENLFLQSPKTPEAINIGA